MNLITSLFVFLRGRAEVLVRGNGSILQGGLAPWICLTLRSDLCRILGEIHASLKNRPNNLGNYLDLKSILMPGDVVKRSPETVGFAEISAKCLDSV